MNTTYIIIATIGVVALLAWFFFSNSGKNAEEIIENETDKEEIPNDKIIVAENIDFDELKKVIKASCGFYNNEEFLVAARFIKIDETHAAITFPYDVEFDVFCYFVNCMINAHFTKLDPVIKAWATIKNNDNESYKHCNNQRALFYIPEEDTEHDNVFFTTENNKCFKLSFDNEDIIEIENIIHPFEFTPEKYLLLQDKEFEDFK